jgi:hypothetical protein
MTDAFATTAAFVLDTAIKAGIRLGTNGDELLISPPRSMPNDSWSSFGRAIEEHREEIIALILEGGK